MSQKFEAAMLKLWERRMVESIGIEPIIIKICNEAKKQQEQVFRQHMTKTERFIFDHFKSRRIKKFALRKFRVVEDRPEPLILIIRFYKSGELIDTIKFNGKVDIKGAMPCKR